MLCRKFELIPIKIGFFMNFYYCSKFDSNKYSDFGQISSKMARREFSILKIFSHTHTCTYVV